MSIQDDEENSVTDQIEGSQKEQQTPTDELAAAKALERKKEMAELRERADAIDKVLTRNGPPEYDWTSG